MPESEEKQLDLSVQILGLLDTPVERSWAMPPT